MKMLWILSTMEIYLILWITMNNSLRILTLRTLAIYQVFSLKKLKSNCDYNYGLMLFNEGAVEVLRKLHESLDRQDVSLDEVCNHPVVKSIVDNVGNLKFVQDVSRTGKLWLQFMDFVSIIRMFIRAQQTRKFELHISSSEQMLPYIAAAGHDKYTVAIRKYLQDFKNLCPCWEKKYKEGSELISFF